MVEQQQQHQGDAPAGSPPADPPAATPPAGNGDNGASGKTYSDEEVKAKLRGQGSRIAELEALKAQQDADLAKFREAEEAKRLADLSAQEQLAELQRQKAEADEKLTALQAREAERLAKLKERNDATIAALPKNLQALVPSALGPEDLSEHLSKLAAIDGQGIAAATTTASGGTRSRTHTTPEEAAEEFRQSSKNKMLGIR